MPDNNSLYPRLRAVLGNYLIGIATRDTTRLGEIEVRAQKAGPTVNFSTVANGALPVALAASAFGLEAEAIFQFRLPRPARSLYEKLQVDSGWMVSHVVLWS